MTDDYSDYERESWLADLYEENASRAREEFRAERLASYYIANPMIARPAYRVRAEAHHLLNTSPSGALVLASAASEVAVSALLVRPLVFGLVHSEALAQHVTKTVLAHRQLDRFGELLAGLLEQLADVNINAYCRPGSGVSLWEEIRRSQQVRNGVVHRAEEASAAEAELALGLADFLLDVLVPLVLQRLGLHLHDDRSVCRDEHIPQDILDRFQRYLSGQDTAGRTEPPHDG